MFQQKIQRRIVQVSMCLGQELKGCNLFFDLLLENILIEFIP